MRRSRAMMSMTLGASLMSCSTTPTYTRPDVPMPDRFGASGATFDLAGQSTSEGWWNDFGSAELDRLVARVLAANNDLAAAKARISQARAVARIAGSSLYPAVGIAGTATEQTGDPTSITTADAHRHRSSVDLAVQASYEFDLWGRNRATLLSSRELARAAEHDRMALAIGTAATTADLYFQTLSIAERIATARQIAGDSARVLKLVEAQNSVGTATELQVEQQRTVVAAFEGAVPILVQQQEDTRHAMAILLGASPDEWQPEAKSLAGVRLPSVMPDLPSDLLERRPDVQASEDRLRSANFDVGVARAAFLPSLSLTGQGGVASNALSSFLSPIGVASAAASLAAPLFDGGRRKGQLRYDRAHVEELVATYRQTSLVAFREVEDALTARTRLAEAEAAATTGEAAARKAASLSQTQFRLGVIDLLTLLDTQRALYQARDTLLQIRLQRLQAAIALYRALAGSMVLPA